MYKFGLFVDMIETWRPVLVYYNVHSVWTNSKIPELFHACIHSAWIVWFNFVPPVNRMGTWSAPCAKNSIKFHEMVLRDFVKISESKVSWKWRIPMQKNILYQPSCANATQRWSWLISVAKLIVLVLPCVFDVQNCGIKIIWSIP